MEPHNKVQLITYPDSLGGDLGSLRRAIDRFFPEHFSGIHILPPYPSSGDRGFAPLTYLEIDPTFGTWDDIRNLSAQFDVVLDLMVNHISSRSSYFQDYLRRGPTSPWSDLFIPLRKLWDDGIPRDADVEKMFLRRTRPYSTFAVGDPATQETVWTTFGRQDPSEQIDLDWRSPQFKSLVSEFFAQFGRQGVRIVRLDAVGYVIKKPGTSCFFVEPDIYEVLEWLAAMATRHGITLLPEVHAKREVQQSLAAHGFWIYDFILPYLVLDALYTGRPHDLRRYILTRPERQFTMLDCHDGVPVKPDLDGIYRSAEAKALVATCLDRGANLSRVFSPKHQDPDGFDVHQIRGTYYSLLGCDDDAYLAARAVQLFVPGIPQIYYVGLLAGKNDVSAVAATGEGREINRHNYTTDEIGTACSQPVVRRLLGLIKFRNQHPAFAGRFFVADSDPHTLRLGWASDVEQCVLEVDFRTMDSTVETTGAFGPPIRRRV
jgi:sucrose 6(F)-phosphate phosphorylase